MILQQCLNRANPIAAVTRPSLRFSRQCVRLPTSAPGALPLHPAPAPTVTRRVACAAEAESPSDSPPSKGMIDYVLGQGVYQLLAGFLGVLSVAVVFASPKVAEIVFGVCLTPVGDLGYRSLGAFVLTVAVTCYCMQSAVGANRLDSPTYKRLSFALMVTLGTMLTVKVIAISNGLAMSNFGAYGTSVIQLLPAVAFFKLYGTSTLPDIIPGMISGVTSLFQPDNINSALYSIISAATMIYGVIAIVNPAAMASVMLVHQTDTFTRLIIQAVGAANYLMSIICFTLKDAADRGRLGFSTFRTLNIAVCLTCLAKIGSNYYVNTTAPATAAGVKQSLLTKFSWIAMIAVYGTLALVSGINAIIAKKE